MLLNVFIYTSFSLWPTPQEFKHRPLLTFNTQFRLLVKKFQIRSIFFTVFSIDVIFFFRILWNSFQSWMVVVKVQGWRTQTQRTIFMPDNRKSSLACDHGFLLSQPASEQKKWTKPWNWVLWMEEHVFNTYNFTALNYYVALTNKYTTLSSSRNFLVK